MRSSGVKFLDGTAGTLDWIGLKAAPMLSLSVPAMVRVRREQGGNRTGTREGEKGRRRRREERDQLFLPFFLHQIAAAHPGGRSNVWRLKNPDRLLASFLRARLSGGGGGKSGRPGCPNFTDIHVRLGPFASTARRGGKPRSHGMRLCAWRLFDSSATFGGFMARKKSPAACSERGEPSAGVCTARLNGWTSIVFQLRFSWKSGADHVF